MRNFTVLPILFILGIMLGCGSGSDDSNITLNSTVDDSSAQLAALSTELAALPIEELSQIEIDAILFMREEEKLARDVYDLFYNLWGQTIFSNISSSEQTHIDSVFLLMDRYQLTDPIVNEEDGVFSNLDLQNLYDILIAIGSNSQIDALMVGAEIEEVDIIDLELRLLETNNQDIQLIFNSLMKGSRNHLRSFASKLSDSGITYIPQHLSQEAYDAIINSPMETGGG